MNLNKIFQKNNYIQTIFFISFFLTPIFFLVGNFAINFLYIFISIISLIGLLFKRIHFNLKDYSFYLLIFLFFSFVVNLLFSHDFSLTFPRVIKFITIILFILSFKYSLNFFKTDKIQKLYESWLIVFLIVTIDLVYEIIFGENILGFKSNLPGRLSGFTGDEMVIGHYFSAFVLIALSTIHLKFKNIKIDFFFIVFFICISFLIGERSNFIKTILIISVFTCFVHKIKLRYALSFLTIFILFSSIVIFNSANYKTRFIGQLKNFFDADGLNYYLNETQYGAHFKISKEIFFNNPFFGVGIKNFRVESFNKKYEGLLSKHLNSYSIDDDYGLSADKPIFGKWTGGSTHPHQIHYELLSETGLFGYIAFIIFILVSLKFSINSYLKEKNLFQLSGILFVIINLVPFLPTGSFFSTYTSGLFWVNYSLMMGYVNFETKF